MYSQGLVLLALLGTSAHAHMTLNSPVPFGLSTLNNSPLDMNGADFPCKQRAGVYDITTMNHWEVGVPQTVSFLGGATHGGGSCQFSLTTDTKPDKNTQWKVIHSIIGGCPFDDPGNLSENPKDTGSHKYQVTVPQGTPEGVYTFAWTWFNKVGNREMYMNCAPVTITNPNATAASAGDLSASIGKLPDMFVANMPNTTCGIVHGQDFVFPSPGDSVEYGTAAGLHTGTAMEPAVGCATQTVFGKGAGKLSLPAQATGGAGGAGSSIANPPAGTSAAVSNPGGVFAPGASSAAGGGGPQTSFTTLVITKTGEAPAATAAPSAPAVSQAPIASQAPASPPASGQSVACTNEGGVVCIGTSQFGLCDHGYAVPQALAAGMTCTNGSITRRSIRHHLRAYRRHGSEMV